MRRPWGNNDEIFAPLTKMGKARSPQLAGWLWVFFAITLFFCLIQSAHDGLTNRNREFDKYRWWYPVYRLIQPPAN